MAPSSSPSIFCPCCGRVLQGQRVQRRFERKAVQLPGILFEATSLVPLASLTTMHVSLNGMAFVSWGADVRVGRAFTVLFRLDDDRQTVIQEDIVVKTIQTNGTIGAAFGDPNRYNFHLDFYLTPASALI